MNWLREVPIRQKLALIIATASLIALIVASIAVFAYELTTFQPRMLQEVTSLAGLYGTTLPAPLQFNDAKAAVENLGTLASRDEIGAACVYTSAGNVFAAYARSTGAPYMCPPVIRSRGHVFEERRLLYHLPLISSGDEVGFLFFQVDLPPFYSRLPQYGIMFSVVILSLLVVSFLLSSALRTNFSQPILALAGVAQRVGDTKDYHVRAAPGGRDEIGALTAAFNQMLETIEQNESALSLALEHEQAARIKAADLVGETQNALRLRDEFISIASHELRTPLTPMKVQLRLLRRLYEKLSVNAELDDDLVSALDLSERQIERLIRLVEDMLDVSRITTGRLALNRETIDLPLLVREVAGRYKSEFIKAHSPVEFAFAVESLVGQWDRLRIEQLIVNLMMNALKYGAGKPIIVSVHKAGEMAKLEVRDLGIGVPIEDQARIFERFERAVSSASFGGLGLGLYITRQIVQAHAGRIYVDSVPGQGATFNVELPLYQVDPGPARAEPHRLT